MSWRKLDMAAVTASEAADAATSSVDSSTLTSVVSTDRQSQDVNKFVEPSHRFANLREKLRAIR